MRRLLVAVCHWWLVHQWHTPDHDVQKRAGRPHPINYSYTNVAVALQGLLARVRIQWAW